MNKVEDQFYGDRSGRIQDPFGHIWMIQTHLETVAPKDMQKRLNAMLRGAASAARGRRAAAKTTGRRRAAAAGVQRRKVVGSSAARKVGRGGRKAAVSRR